jgi:hypothetical protein
MNVVKRRMQAEKQGFQVEGGLIPTPEKTRPTSDAKGTQGPSVRSRPKLNVGIGGCVSGI